MKLDDITLAKAYSEWRAAASFNIKVYDIMMYIVKHDNMKVIINRNPTLIVIWCH